MSNELRLGLKMTGCGLIGASIGGLIVNYLWYKFCKKQNDDRGNTCKAMSDDWHKHCEKVNNDWAAFCMGMIDDWHKHCEKVNNDWAAFCMGMINNMPNNEENEETVEEETNE